MADIVEQFAAAWALKQLVDKATKTGVKGNLRDQVNTYYRSLYQADGDRGHDILVNGEKVGRYTFPETKGEEGYTRQTIAIYDYDALLADDNPDFAAWLKRKIHNQLFDLAKEYAAETGDLLDGMTVIEEEVPEVPATVSPNGRPGSIKPEVVAEAFGPQLSEGMDNVIAGLLESAR